MSIVKLNNKAVSNATAFGSITSLGSMTFIKKLTASSSATLSFVDGSDGVVLDDTYKEYVFTFKDIHPQNSGANALFEFQGSTDGGSTYGVTITSTAFFAYHNEADSITSLSYDVNDDLAQSTNFQHLCNRTHNDNDSCMVGTLQLFNPSSTTFVKHFLGNCNSMHENPMPINERVAGYFNTTNAINAIQFKFNTGNIDAGDICLYGIA